MQAKRSSRRKIPADELAATAAAALATLPIVNKQMVLPSGGSIGTSELPLFAGGTLQSPETEKNNYSNCVLNLIISQKRLPGGGTSSRRRAADSELDMAVVSDQLCNRRYHVKEIAQNIKVSVIFLKFYGLMLITSTHFLWDLMQLMLHYYCIMPLQNI